VQVGIHGFFFTGLIGYYFIGHLLMRVDLSYKSLWGIVAVVILAIAFTAIVSHLLTVRNGGQYNGHYLKLYQPNIIILSICMFLILQKINSTQVFTKFPITNIIRNVSTASFGIYLLHPIILELLEDGWLGFHLCAMTFHPIVGIPMTLIVTILVTFLVISLFRKVPILKSVVP